MIKTKVPHCALGIFVLTLLGGALVGSSQNLPPEAAVQALVATYGSGFVNGSVVDWIADGKLTVFNAAGPEATFDVTVLRKGKQQVQRIIKQPAGQVLEGSDGTTNWSSVSGRVSMDAKGPALYFIQSQTVRSVHTLLNSQANGLILRDSGVKGMARVIEAEDKAGSKTSYFIDSATSTITQLQFVVGQSTDPFSKRAVPDVERYVFSDFRVIQGLRTPFKIERYSNSMKMEEMQFTSVRYNASVADQAFRP